MGPYPAKFKRDIVAGPSSNGRTPDFGSGYGGSNPPGPIAFPAPCFALCPGGAPLRERNCPTYPPTPRPICTHPAPFPRHPAHPPPPPPHPPPPPPPPPPPLPTPPP